MLPVRFRRCGRRYHPVIDTVADLEAVCELGDAYWVATAAPIVSLRGDRVFYQKLDGDGDGRIRSDEVKAAIRWLFDSLGETSGLTEGVTALRLEAIDPEGPHGALIVDAAHKVSGDDGVVELDEVRTVLAAEVERGLSEAGRVLPAAAGEDVALKGFLEQVVAVTGGVAHPDGGPAVDEASLATFLESAKSWLAWVDAGAVEENATTDLMPLGPATGAAHQAVEAVADKVEQYFLLCEAVALDAALADHARVDPKDTDSLDPEQASALLTRAPLAVPDADGQLDPTDALNPTWRVRVESLFSDAVKPLLGSDTLDREGWATLRARLAPHRTWLAERPQDAAGDLSTEELRAWVTDGALAERTRDLLEASVQSAVAVDGLHKLERLLLFHGHLFRFANNMVAMPELMAADQTGLVEQGRLVIDGREFDFSVGVTDPARAETFGSMSPIFTMFVRIGLKNGAWTREIAVPVTAGERGHLVEGQWGVFFPADGGELNAQIRKVASSPISIKEALFAPFRRLNIALQSAADKAAEAQTASMDKSVGDKAASVTTTVTDSPKSAVQAGQSTKETPPTETPAAPAPAEPGWSNQLPMLLAGGGIALAALASAGAYVVEVIWSGAGQLAASLMTLGFVTQLPVATQSVVQVLALPLALLLILLGLLLVPFLIYAVPVSIATWLRLRQRDLASLLEGAGWAINTRLMLDRGHAVRLTRRPGDSVR